MLAVSASLLSVPAKATLPSRVFAPYIQMGSQSLTSVSQASGIKYFTLAFIVSDPSSSQQPMWEAGSTVASDTSIAPSIAALRAAGGDVIISFGGAGSTELAVAITNVSSLQSVYQGILNKYNVTALDFDIEGSELGNTAANDRRNQALANLQAANPGLLISYTLGVNPTGLPTGSGSEFALLQNAQSHAVNVACVNIMAMDYGSSTSPSMGQDAIDATNATISQLNSIGMTASVGITVLIGKQDTAPEVFTLSDAQTTENYALGQSRVNRIAFWEVARDQCGSSCSGVTQTPWQYSHIFEPFSGGSTTTVATPVFSPGGGTYGTAQNVTISDSTGGASIRYTTDGSTPTPTTGTIYSGPVNISSTATLKAVGYESGDTTSAVASATYTISAVEGPFGGTPAAIPGTVQAENYDTGGQGVAYNVTSINGTDTSYRSDAVDLEVTSDTGGGDDLGWTSSGQWFKYTVNVATAGTYTVSFRVAAPTAVTGAFHLANSSGANLSGAVNVPATGGYQTWATVTANVTLPAGQQVLTLDQDNAGWNLNYASFAQVSGSFTITASAGSGGSISPSGSVGVNQGASQSFTITPNSGFNISSVMVDGANQGAITSFTFSNVQANHTISATFTSTGGCTNETGTTNTPLSLAQSGTFTATWDATPSISGINATMSLCSGSQTAYASYSCIARFFTSGDIDAYNGTGYTSASTIPYSGGTTYHFEMDVNVTAHTYSIYVTPAGGSKTLVGSNYAFRSTAGSPASLDTFNVDISGGGAVNICNLAVGGGTNFTITASAGSGGSISPSGSVLVSQGGNQTFTIAPNSGFNVSSVTVDGANQGAITSFTFSNVQANHTISATFQAVITTFTITANAGSGGSISPSGTVTVNQGSNQSFTIAANSGFTISSVTVDGVNQGAITSFTFSNVQANHTISAAFQATTTTFTITASAGSGGSISPSGTVTVNQGANQTFTITPNSGFTVSSVTVDGANQGAITSFTFSNVQANHTISATFASSSRTLTGSSGNGWHALAISPAATGTFTATYDATPSVSPENAVVGLSNGAATGFGNLGCIARFNPSGDIDAYNGSAYAAAATIPYSAGVSYHFRLVVNVTAHTYSVFVTPSGGSELTVGSNFAFRSTANTMTSLNDWNLFVDSSIGGASLTANNLSP